MDIIKLGLSVAVLVLLTLLRVPALAAEIGALGGPVNSPSVQIAEAPENLLWVNCRLEIIRSREVYKDLDLSILGTLDTNVPDDPLMSVLQQQIGPELLNCIRETVSISPISGDDSSSSERYMKLLRSLVSKLPSEMRRYLAVVSEKPSQELVQAPASAPSPTSSGHVVSGNSDAESNKDAPTSAPSPTSYGHVVSGNSDAELNKDNSNHKTIVIAVVVTAVVTFICAFLFFLCCRKICGKHYGNAYKDDRPLLSISMSDYSGSPKSDVFHSSSHLTGFQFYGSNTVEGKRVGSLEGKLEPEDRVDKFSMQTSTLKSNGSHLPLKPPPGRVPPPGLPPSKPPPGKAKPLPPEPPAYLRPSPNRVSPPPSPPATPPPPPPAPPAPPPPPPTPPAPPRKPPSIGVGPPLGSAPPPPPAPGIKTAVRPPPLLKSGVQPPRPPSSSGMQDDVDASRTKLKPFFWDKVLADPDHSMVWHQIKSGSFQFNEEMIESLFGYVPSDRNKPARQKDSSDSPSQFIQLIDSKKAQNLSILLRALNVTTEEVCDALEQGNELPSEFLETLLKMAPTPEEELKLRLFGGELSQLGPAERFLKVLVDIPFAFKRMDVLLFMCTFEEEVASITESFTVLEAACKELTNSRLFLKLLEAVLKTGNRMNDGTFRGGAQAFKLDTLLKLSDVKGIDGKTTLLHFVVQQIICSEGIRVARAGKNKSFSSVKSDDLLQDMEEESEEELCSLGLQEVSSLGEQLQNVKKAGGVDGDNLTGSIAKLRASYIKTRNFLNSEMKNVDEGNGFHRVLKCFVEEVNAAITSLSEEEMRITDLMKSTADYFHGTAGKEEGLRLFVIVRDFLIMLDRVCAEVRRDNNKKSKSNSRIQKRDLQFL